MENSNIENPSKTLKKLKNNEIKNNSEKVENLENNKMKKDIIEMGSEIEVSLEKEIPTEKTYNKANKNCEISDLNFHKINLNNSQNKSNNENKFDDETNVNQDKKEKNYISQDNSSPVVLEIKEKVNKKSKKR